MAYDKEKADVPATEKAVEKSAHSVLKRQNISITKM